MLVISHRGNINGPKPEFENNPANIVGAMGRKLVCEIDVWLLNNQWYLGHDFPKYPVKWEWLNLHKAMLICHAKNVAAFEELLANRLHTFMHQNDPMVLTSHNYIVCMHYVGWPKNKAIVMCPELVSPTLFNASLPFAVCTDYPVRFIENEW
jgi:hypothetical protein